MVDAVNVQAVEQRIVDGVQPFGHPNQLVIGVSGGSNALPAGHGRRAICPPQPAHVGEQQHRPPAQLQVMRVVDPVVDGILNGRRSSSARWRPATSWSAAPGRAACWSWPRPSAGYRSLAWSPGPAAQTNGAEKPSRQARWASANCRRMVLRSLESIRAGGRQVKGLRAIKCRRRIPHHVVGQHHARRAQVIEPGRRGQCRQQLGVRRRNLALAPSGRQQRVYDASGPP